MHRVQFVQRAHHAVNACITRMVDNTRLGVDNAHFSVELARHGVEEPVDFSAVGILYSDGSDQQREAQ
ncbi:hypothetical protein [Cryobacterium sp. Y11]|uniref:hypothetical protein n=1 Tax=Cryobacterium sp. Y11 TaxID=2045016 RepID=UPI000CE46C35|nr:hypothetical protein [Cryobacterium sp. Y11]